MVFRVVTNVHPYPTVEPAASRLTWTIRDHQERIGRSGIGSGRPASTLGPCPTHARPTRA